MSGEATLICWVLICPGGCGLLRVDRFLLCTEQSKDCPRMRKSELWPFRARPCYFRPLCLESGVSLALNLCCALRQMDEKHNPGKRSRLFCIYTNVTPFICLFFFFYYFFYFFSPSECIFIVAVFPWYLPFLWKQIWDFAFRTQGGWALKEYVPSPLMYVLGQSWIFQLLALNILWFSSLWHSSSST